LILAAGESPIVFIDQLPFFWNLVAVAEAVFLSAAINKEPVESLNDQEGMLIVERFDWDEGDHSVLHSSGTLPSPLP
jgi:hypothetical protein